MAGYAGVFSLSSPCFVIATSTVCWWNAIYVRLRRKYDYICLCVCCCEVCTDAPVSVELWFSHILLSHVNTVYVFYFRSSVMPKGQIVRSEARALVKNIIAACEEERHENRLKFPLWKPTVRAAHYAGLGISTIKRIKSQCKDGNEPSSPVRYQAGKKSFRIALSEKEMCAIRDEVQKYYLEHRNSPTSDKVLQFMQNRIAFKWKRETLRQVKESDV